MEVKEIKRIIPKITLNDKTGYIYIELPAMKSFFNEEYSENKTKMAKICYQHFLLQPFEFEDFKKLEIQNSYFKFKKQEMNSMTFELPPFNSLLHITDYSNSTVICLKPIESLESGLLNKLYKTITERIKDKNIIYQFSQEILPYLKI